MNQHSYLETKHLLGMSHISSTAPINIGDEFTKIGQPVDKLKLFGTIVESDIENKRIINILTS